MTAARASLAARMWRNRHFYVFISPFFLLFAVFGLYPIGYSLYLSFVTWDGMTDQTWVGLLNYTNLFRDDVFWTSLWNTVAIGAFYIPPMFILAFLFALLLNQTWLRCRGLFRAAFFMPVVTPMVVIAIVFSLLYSPEAGMLNYALAKLSLMLNCALVNLTGWNPDVHFGDIPWLVSERWSKVSVAILVVWRWTGYNMVLMLAGLQGIDEGYYEAATLDGANAFQRMRHITLPLMRPTFVFCAVMSLIGTVYMFEEVFVLTLGGPGISSTNFGLYLFNLAFTDFHFGYASSAAYTVAFVVFLGSMALIRLQRNR